MSTSSNDPDQLRVKGTVMSDKAYGTLLCILSDTLFSVVYIFVQFINRGWFLQGETFSPDWRGDWILCFKEWIAAMFAIPIFIYLWRTGKTSIPGIKVILGLIAAAFFCEYIGIGHHVLANDLIGMALGLPVIRTITILGCAIFGAILLREKITLLKLGMICVLIAAVSLFGFSNSLAKKAQETPAAVPAVTADAVPEVKADAVPEVKADASVKADEHESGVQYGTFRVPLDARTFGFLCAFITGMGYATYMLILRAVMKKPEVKEGEEAPKPVSAYFVVSMVFGFGGLFGFIAMLSKMRAEGTPLSALCTEVPAACWLSILAAGILTFFAFYLKNLSYRYASASKAAAMSVLQVLLNIFAGMLIFSEPTNPIFWGGVVLTFLGILLASRTS